MPRPKYGLGQGLEALVSPRQAHSAPYPGATSPKSLTGDDAEAVLSPPVRWEYACLRIKRASKKRRVVLILSCPDTHVKPRKQRLRGMGRWTAIGLLGFDGWEMVSMTRRVCYFKRPMAG